MRHVFLRHPPLPDHADLCYGRQDIALPPAVFEHASRLLRGTLPAWPMLSSPAARCIGLAYACAEQRPVRTDPRLQEMDFGAWQGLPWSQVPRPELDRWSADVCGYSPPDGESFLEVIARVRALLGELREPHVLVTHAGVIRAAMHLIEGLAPERAAAFVVPYAEPILLPARVVP